MTASASLKRAAAALPLFRCKGGWRRGETRISYLTGRKLLRLGLAEVKHSRSGTPMLVAGGAAPPPTPPHKGEGSPAAGARAWWLD